ncbi:MAG: DnaJ domain-containing protein [Deltaproteobacteria bacterium]|nr:DnaJ domain-containing protein [Deltaproteobacteria bacterium]
MRDLYQALGLSVSADAPEIKKAYRELTRRFHPDLNPGRQWAAERYKEVVSAYEVLSDPRRRPLYDEFGEIAFTRGFDPERARRAREAQAHPTEGAADSGLWSRDVMDFADLEEVRRTRFDDFLDRFFGGARVQERPEQGLDLRASLGLRAHEFIGGATRRVRYAQADGEWTSTAVEVAPGTAPGSLLTLPGLGAPGEPPGALLLELRLEAEAGLRTDGADLHVETEVSLGTLYAGGCVEVVLSFGRFEVKVPPATAPHQPLRLRGQGLPTNDGPRGDLLVALRLAMPPAGDAGLLEALRRLEGQRP